MKRFCEIDRMYFQPGDRLCLTVYEAQKANSFLGTRNVYYWQNIGKFQANISFLDKIIADKPSQ